MLRDIRRMDGMAVDNTDRNPVDEEGRCPVAEGRLEAHCYSLGTRMVVVAVAGLGVGAEWLEIH